MFRRATEITILLTLLAIGLAAQPVSPSGFSGLRWRSIGPFRAGRTVGATGIPSQPNVFFIGVNNGGVWKTTDAGRTWRPIFDDQPTGSIGDLAIAPSDPNIIYVGSGEGLQRPDLSTGNGIYKSTDGGRSWRHLGLRDAQQIGSIIVDPTNPKRVFVAALGHPYGPNTERGVYRSLDGGETWERVLYKDENTGAIQVAFDPGNPQILYADLWAARQGPWENGAWQGPGSGLFKSVDGGKTWRQLTKGLPDIAGGLGRIGFDISRSHPRTIYATVDANPDVAGIYRSDDGGESWRRLNGEPRIWGRGSDFAEIRVHPRNPEIVFAANTASYKSTDGGKSFTGFKGAPGGDDYHRIWINPEHPDVMLFATDQGATITVNGGETWSSWYNQPTAQFYHVSTDNRFPYWVYGGQQESGSAAVASRGDYGAITWRDWRTVGVEEYGYIAPDPLDPDITYGGKITRFDWKSGQVQNISPEVVRSGKYRFLRTAPVIFSPVDPKRLYYAGNVLFQTTTGGQSWEVISPDLSRDKWEIPENIGVYSTPEMATMPRRGVIYTIAPSFHDANIIWAGTDDGLIHLTRDGGKSWTNITPPQLKSWAKVSLIEASHFDRDTAYAAVNTFRLDDLRPHIYRTTDAGKSWTEITRGLPDGGIVNAVREDTQRRGLLYAGTEQSVYVSFDNGGNWQSLRLNLPATSIRDLVVKDDDLVVGTHGRSFWILDNLTPLRQIDRLGEKTAAILFTPQTAWRYRRSLNTDTPIPPEEPMGENPPDGAIIDYWLKSDARTVSIEIRDQNGAVVRRYHSDDRPVPLDPRTLAYPEYWVRPARQLATGAGMHRFVWDLHYPAPEGFPRSLPISAIYRNTPSLPEGPLAHPGEYSVTLTVDGKSQTTRLKLKMDPRVSTPAEGLAQQFRLSIETWQALAKTHDSGLKLADRIRQLQIGPRTPDQARQLDAATRKDRQLNQLRRDLLNLLNTLQEADAAPTSQAVSAAGLLREMLGEILRKMEE
ncbi:MAG: glycoside hydrolase [Blastocatellia bacterium]|jgi:photosystem II stability/assembly factor-like uncharacterized protein